LQESLLPSIVHTQIQEYLEHNQMKKYSKN